MSPFQWLGDGDKDVYAEPAIADKLTIYMRGTQYEGPFMAHLLCFLHELPDAIYILLAFAG